MAQRSGPRRVSGLGEAETRGARLQSFGFWLCLTALVLAPWPYGSAVEEARFALVAALMGAASFWSWGRSRVELGPPAVPRAALGLIALAALQIVFGRSLAPVWTAEAGLVLVAMAAAFAVLSEAARAPRRARWIARAVLASCALQAVFGAWQWSSGPGRIYGRTTPVVTTPFGSYVNHNHFAGLMEMGTLLAAGWSYGLVRQRRVAAAILVATFAGCTGVAHLASRSRGGLLALIAGFVRLIALVGLRRRAMAPIFAIALLAAGAGTFALFSLPASTRAHLATLLDGGADAAGVYRREIAGASLRTALAKPLFGSGLGAFADAVPLFKRGHGDVRATHAECDLLEWVAEGGALGLLLAAWLIATLARGFFERFDQGRDPERRGLAMGAAAGAGALLVHSLFDFNLRIPANAVTLVALAALAAAPRHASSLGGRRSAQAASALLAAFAAAAAWRAHGAATLARALEAPPSQRLVQLDGVLSRHPYSTEALRARGELWRALAAGRPPALAAARLRRAERDFLAALRFRPQWAEAKAELAVTRFRLGDLHGARQAYAEAVRLDPTHRGIAQARAEFLVREDGIAAALEELERLEDADPSWNAAREKAAALARWRSVAR